MERIRSRGTSYRSSGPSCIFNSRMGTSAIYNAVRITAKILDTGTTRRSGRRSTHLAKAASRYREEPVEGMVRGIKCLRSREK